MRREKFKWKGKDLNGKGKIQTKEERPKRRRRYSNGEGKTQMEEERPNRRRGRLKRRRKKSNG